MGTGQRFLGPTRRHLVQRTYGQKTNVARLFAYVRANANDPEFFIQKAIGWALRSYAKTDQNRVRTLLAELKVSPLAFVKQLDG